MDSLGLTLLFLRISLIVLILVSRTTWLQKIIIAVVLHLLLMFLLSRLVVPRLGFWKAPLPKRLPKSLSRRMLSKRTSKEKVLKDVYDVVTENFTGERDPLQLNFGGLFWSDHERVWKKGGVAHCNTQVHFMRLLLIKSKKFKEEDIELVHHPVALLAIHQILKVKLKKGWVYVDPWAKSKGLPFARRIDYWFKIGYKPYLYDGIYRKE